MRTTFGDPVQYTLPLYDVLEPADEVPMNEFIGRDIRLSFDHNIHCVVTGKKIKKTYGEGMSYDAFRQSPLAVESIIRPELSRAHEGIGLRDLEWEQKHDIQPHYVYLAMSSGVKVGVTRAHQIPTRWIDQGACEGLLLAETPYRQLAGLIEVALKEHVQDKTNWRKMLTNNLTTDKSLVTVKNELVPHIPEDLKEYLLHTDETTKIHFPVERYPEKVKSMKLDKFPEIEKKLVGIKGQYLIFDDDSVINIRSHAGYEVTIEG